MKPKVDAAWFLHSILTNAYKRLMDEFYTPDPRIKREMREGTQVKQLGEGSQGNRCMGTGKGNRTGVNGGKE
jgi:hypothetical protein